MIRKLVGPYDISTVAVTLSINSSLNGPFHPSFSRHIIMLLFSNSWSVGATLGSFRIASASFI